MELKLKIDGKEKTFKQDKVTFVTMKKAMAYQKHLISQMKEMDSLLGKGIEDDIESTQDPEVDLEMAVDLIVSYFDQQFSYDDFISGGYFESTNSIYGLAYDIMYVVLGIKETEDTVKKAQELPKK